MCVVSMVMDYYGPKLPEPWPTQTATGTLGQVSSSELDIIRKLIQEFKEAVEAAKKVDKLTAQPDCVDPEKAKLEQRVATLERRLDAMASALK